MWYGLLTTLVVPSRCPAAGAQGLVGQHKLHASVHPLPIRCYTCAHLAAGSKVLALGDDALVVVDVVLPAVLGLVLVGEAGIEAYMRRSLLARHIAYFELHMVDWQAVQAVGRVWGWRTSCAVGG